MAKVSNKNSRTDFSDYNKWNELESGSAKKTDFSDYSSYEKQTSVAGQPSVLTEEPFKKKVDTVSSGETSFLGSKFRAKDSLFDSVSELQRLGEIQKALTPEERAQKAEEARQEKISQDKLANYKRSVIYDAISNSADIGYMNKGFVAGIADVGAAAVGMAGLLSNFRPSGLSNAEYVMGKWEEERTGVTPRKATTNIALEAASELSNLSRDLSSRVKREVGISEEDLEKGPVDLFREGKIGDGLKVLSVEITKSIPNVIVQSALAPEASVGFLAQKAATFGTTSAMALGGNIAQDYALDKDISGEDILKGTAKAAIEGLTESFFMGDIKALKGIGTSLASGEAAVAKEILKGVIEKEGKEAAKQEIARGFSKPLAKMLGKGFEGASVLGQFNKGGVEEGIEEVMSTVGSFIVDRVADGKWSDADYNQLVRDASNAFAVGYGSGGMMNGLNAGLSMKKLTDEQKAKVEKFNEVANNDTLPAEVRKIAKDKANDIVRESADLSYAGYDELSKIPVEKRVKAFTMLSEINAQEESKKGVKDLDMIDAIDKSIEAKKGEYNYLLTGIKPSVEVVSEEPITEEQKQTQAQIKTEEQAYREELAKAEASFKITMGVPTEPLKISPDFSIKSGIADLTPNNEFEPSPNYPIEIDKQPEGKRIQFTTKDNPDALLEADIYTVKQGNNKFATILSTNRNGVQEYYVPELPSSKPFSNLDDAKYAVQEKLTGRLVPELERSGINRLRADKFIPKADIVIKNDDGQDVLLDPVVKKNIKNAVKAFKSVSSAPVYLYKNTEDFNRGIAKELGNREGEIEAAGKVGGGFFTNNRDEDSIHINLANISETTVAHELFHGTVVNIARQNPSAFAAMRDAIINKLGESDLINVVDEKGNLKNISAKEYLDLYSKQYSPSEQAQEFLSELTGLLAADKAKLKDATIWESIKLAIRNLVKTAGINVPIFDETANINETVKFFNDLSKSFKTGQKIEFGKFNIANEKQGATKGETDKQGEVGKEEEGIQSAVAEAVEQRRKGNELGKKARKLSALASKAMQIEPTNPNDYALQYFINGGQVIRGSKDETKEKDTLFTLFSKSRMGGSKEIVSEMRARVRIVGGRDAGGLSISQIAEKIFAEYQQATKGDVGADVVTRYDYMDFKNAVEDALLGYKSDSAMATALLESKNKPTEEGAATLTEDEEFEKLRIQAEASSMGMTEQEFMAKLAELQDNPEVQSIEDAYVQALDMINDEDMAKLYELSDEDMAKIDELMAGLDDKTGTLDDKLAEQKKIVRDLEAERKKIVAAIEKAGKETQLDITGKAPIQEQLFGTDTKSLTDRLNAVDMRLITAKADVVATQAAIDFQERGTVDMFEEEAKPVKPAKEDKVQAEIKSIQSEIEEYEREIEDATEEIENTKYNYREDADKIKAEKQEALSAPNLSRDEKDEIKEDFQGRLEDAANDRDDYIEQYKEQIAEAKAEIKKLNKRLAKLQTQQPAAEATPTETIDEKALLATAKKMSKANEVTIVRTGNFVAMEFIFEDGNRNILYKNDEDALKNKIDIFETKLSGLINRDLVNKQNDLVELAKDPSTTASKLSDVKKQINRIKDEIKDIEQIQLPFVKYVLSTMPKPSTPAGEVTKPIVDETEPVSNTDKIEDYGEKIGGAKKDLVKKALDSYDMEMEVDTNVKYSQLLPLLNYNALIKEGTLTQDKAILIDYIKGRVPTKPKSYNKSRWISQMVDARVKIYRILNDDLDIDNLISDLEMEDPFFSNQYRTLKGLGFPQSGLTPGNYFIREFNKNDFTVINGFRIVGERRTTFDAAVADLAEILKGNKSKTKETKFDVYRNRTTKEIYIGKKAGRDIVKVMEGFGTPEEAFKYISENRPALEQVWKEMRQNPEERRGENRARVGEDYRRGRNISGEEFGKTFGFRGVEFGNWVNNKERQESVNDAYDALMDLSAALGISPKSISLGGKLGLAFGARGSGKAMAHYERGKTVINLTKTKGAGSLAHEWWHALDNYFASPKSDKYMTEGTRDSGIKARQEIKDAFSNIVNTINKETAIKSRSSKLDTARTDSYWSTDIEMTARSFESFVVSKLAETGNSNDYLANFKELTDWSNGGSVSAESYPYPSPEEKDVINKAYQELFSTVQEKEEGAKTILFQKQGISIAPTAPYKYNMDEMFKDPQRLTKDIEAKYDIRTTLRERGEAEGKMIEVERALTDQIVTNSLSKVGIAAFKTIGAIENAPLFKAGTGRTVKLKEALTGWSGYTANELRTVTLKAIQSNNKYAASTGRVAASLIGNLAKSDILQEQRRLRTGAQLDANNSIAMLSKGLNGMIGFDERALMRVHSLLDPEAFIESEDSVTSPSEFSLQELRLYNTLRDTNDFIHEWHFQNGFIDQPTYDKHKGKYFARMYEEIERKEFADLHEAIDKMPAGADFRMFKERKDFSEVELTLMNDPIYITSKRLATMLHNKATLEFCNAMANDPSYKIYKKESELPENNKKGFKLLESSGGGKRYGELTNKYVPLALYEELRGTTFANKFISASYDVLRMYDGLDTRQLFKKTKTLYNPTTRLGNITTNFAFGWLAGVDPFTMIKNRVKAKDSLDAYDSWAKELGMAGILGTNIVTSDLIKKKEGEGVLDFLQKAGVREDIVKKAKELDKYLVESYGRTDDVAKISLYRSLVEDYGKSKEEAIRTVAESMQNYATVGKAYQFFSKVPVFGNPFVKFSSDMARIVANGFANRPLYMASFLGMMYGVARLLSTLSGEPEEEREARESRAFIPKIPLGFTDIPLTWKVGKYEVNAARFISPYYVYDAGYRSNTIAELTKFAPIQLSYDNKIGFASDYFPVMGDPYLAPLAQVVLDKDFRGLPIADPRKTKYTGQTVTDSEALWNRANYLGHSYASPAWGYIANLYNAATGQGDLYGRRRDIPSAIINSVIKVQEMESKDVQRAVINQVKYIDSEYKQIKADITSRRNDDIDRIQDIISSDATESQKESQILDIKASYSNFVEDRISKMQELKMDRDIPMNRLYKIQNPKKND
jgi:hypothetical protein